MKPACIRVTWPGVDISMQVLSAEDLAIFDMLIARVKTRAAEQTPPPPPDRAIEDGEVECPGIGDHHFNAGGTCRWCGAKEPSHD